MHSCFWRLVRTSFVCTDLVGFTGLSEKLGPEGVAKVINRYLAGVSQLAFEHGGTVDKFIGDAVMILFGAPDQISVQEQARKSVVLAQAIHRMVETIEAPVPLSARTGINTGEAIVGMFGSQWRTDYTAVGPVVNIAARLECASEPGGILVGQETADLLGEGWSVECAGELILKGVSQPVQAYFVANHDPT